MFGWTNSVQLVGCAVEWVKEYYYYDAVISFPAGDSLFTVTREFLQRSHIWRGVDCFLWRCLIKQHLSTICMVMFNKPSIIGWSHWFGLAALWNQPCLANLRLWLTSDNNSLEHSKLHVDQVALLRSISEEIRGDETQICGDEICTNTRCVKCCIPCQISIYIRSIKLRRRLKEHFLGKAESSLSNKAISNKDLLHWNVYARSIRIHNKLPT